MSKSSMILAVLLLMPTLCAGQSSVEHKVSTLDKLIEKRFADAETISESYLADRRQTVTTLVAQLSHKDGRPPEKLWPIYLLGELRAPEAVDVLLAHIDYQPPRVDPKLAVGRWGPRPAVDALTKIGRPSSRAILDRLPMESDGSRRKLMYEVLYNVEGKGLSLFLLQERQAQASTNEQKQILAEAVASIQSRE